MSDELFDITGLSVAVTGGAGVLCGAMAKGLAVRGAKVCVIDFDAGRSKALCDEIAAAGGTAVCIKTDVLDADQVAKALDFC
ncbi:MAG: SDR family NAD(P)-dependent oxidoreductase, partial [Phycisphaerae bacterium]|nr:SDR family NAD(P)-dependent oxidoreductase [Phycisphaerae bacterium]